MWATGLGWTLSLAGIEFSLLSNPACGLVVILYSEATCVHIGFLPGLFFDAEIEAI
jgi:hypothetical protein